MKQAKDAKRHAMSTAVGALALCLCACQTERITTSDGWPLPPAPRSAPPTPALTKADRMVFMVCSKPDDTNNNGFPDSISATVALFSSRFPTSLRQPGSFVFEIYSQGESGGSDSKPARTWRVPGDNVRSYATAQYGPYYRFELSLLENGGDRMPLDRADLICRFEPADQSAPVQSAGVRTIQIGRRMAAGTASNEKLDDLQRQTAH